MGIKEVQTRISKADKSNLALFLRMESDQYIAVFLSLADKKKREFILGSFNQERKMFVEARIRLIMEINQYALDAIEYGLNVFNKKFPYVNHSLDDISHTVVSKAPSDSKAIKKADKKRSRSLKAKS